MEIIDIGMKLMKLFLFLFSLYSLEYKIYANGNQDSFKENTSSNINEFQNKFNLNNSSEIINFTSKSLNSKSNIELLYLRAKIYYNSSEYYKSLKDCEEYIKLSKIIKLMIALRYINFLCLIILKCLI